MHHAPVVDNEDHPGIQLHPVLALRPLNDAAQLGDGVIEPADGFRCRRRPEGCSVVVVVPDAGQGSGDGLSRKDGSEISHVVAWFQVLVVDGRVAQETEVVRVLRAQLLGGVEAVNEQRLPARAVVA